EPSHFSSARVLPLKLKLSISEPSSSPSSKPSKVPMGVVGSVNAIPEIHAQQDGIVCPRNEFQAKVISVNALCQLPGDKASDESCRLFGERCIGMRGKWGCGNFDGEENHRGCLFRPMFSPNGPGSNIVFDNEVDEYRERGNVGNQCVFGRRVARSTRGRYNATDGGEDDDDDKDATNVDLGFSDVSGFFATSIISGVSEYNDIYDELREIEEGTEEQAIVTSAMVLKIAGMLAVKGFKLPISRWQCQGCKATCNVLFAFKSSWKNACKYDTCVKYLGKYGGSDSKPSCSII
ncbi:hypothetical protein BGZ79_003377, partial [Entomortierella chlamydospora]